MLTSHQYYYYDYYSMTRSVSADYVGFMLNGRILASGPPRVLMQQAGKESLEETFLLLCQIESIAGVVGGPSSSSVSADDSANVPLLMPTAAAASPSDLPVPENEDEEKAFGRPQGLSSSSSAASAAAAAHKNSINPARHDSTSSWSSLSSASSSAVAHGRDRGSSAAPPPSHSGGAGILPRLTHVYAVLWKNLMEMRKNTRFLLFNFFLPAFQLALYCWAIGNDPRFVDINVVQLDVGLPGASDWNMGKTYVDLLDTDSAFRISRFDSLEVAIYDLSAGRSSGVVYVPRNFTVDLLRRYGQCSHDVSVVEGTSVHLTLDETDSQVAVFIQKKAMAAYQATLGQALNRTGMPPELAANPIVIDPPVFGVKSPQYRDFIAPAILSFILFSQSIAMTAIVLVIDRKEGTLERAWISGVRPSEVIISQVLTQLLVLSVQITVVLLILLVGFELPQFGSLFCIVCLCFLLGLSGMLYGMVISSMSTNEHNAMQVVIGSILPLLMCSGVIWPLSGAPAVMRYVGTYLPRRVAR